jgi:hypothetical protein
MRVAGGVILIISAVINLFAALGYFAIGGAGKLAAGSSSAYKQAVADAQKQQGREMTTEDEAALAKIDAAAGKASASAGALMGFGVFLLVTVGTSIGGAVCLFRSKAAKFIIVASALAILAEVGSSVIFGMMLGASVGAAKLAFSAMGLLGGIFGFLGARQILAANAVPVEAQPVAAAPM